MYELDIQRIKAVLLYILNKMPNEKRDVYHIVKAAFYAQKYHFVRYALPLFNDSIVALPFGPVPSLIYNILKVARGETIPYRFCDNRILARISQAIGYQDESFSANESADLDCLSQSNIECLNDAINKISQMGFDAIMKKTHGGEWKRAFHDATNGHLMDNLNIAKENGATDETLSYLSETLDFDKLTN